MSDERGADDQTEQAQDEPLKPPAGPPPVDLNRAVRNESLVEAIAASFAERTDAAAERLWRELNEADFLIAVAADAGEPGGSLAEGAEDADGERPIEVMSVTDGEGRVFLPVFSDWDALAAFTAEPMLTLVMPGDEVWTWVLETDEYAGAVVNPGGQAVVLDEGQLSYLLFLVEEQVRAAERARAGAAQAAPAADQGPSGASRAGSVETHHEQTLRFVGEQDGPAERELLLVLTDLFARTPAVTRAYLARVDYGVPGPYEVALCLRGDEDPALVGGISRQFASLFGEDVHLDILFLDDELEDQLRRVCAPFYDDQEAPRTDD